MITRLLRRIADAIERNPTAPQRRVHIAELAQLCPPPYGTRVWRMCADALRVEYADELQRFTINELRSLPNIGVGTITQLQQALKKTGQEPLR